MKKALLLVLASAALTSAAESRDQLYRATLLQAAPGRLLELIEEVRPTENQPRIVLRHAQGDFWDLMLLEPIGNYLGAGIEHDEHGAPTASGRVHAVMNEKRIKKLGPLHKRDDLFRVEGDENAPLALVSWGSSAGVCREAAQLAADKGLDVKLLVPYLLYPVNEDIYRRFFASVVGGLVVEQSHLGQLYRILRMYVDVPAGVRSFCRSGANPFRPKEIVAELRDLALGLQRSVGESRQPQE